MSPLISAAELNKVCSESIVVDCRFDLGDSDAGRRAYTASHIPGAHYLDLEVDLSAPVGRHGGRHPLPDVAAFATTIAEIGIDGSRLVVIYDDSKFCFAARLWWMLTALGYSSVRVLDGGFAAWRAEGLPVTDAPSPARPAAVPALEGFSALVDRSWLLAQGESVTTLVDSRDARRYAGLEEPIDPVAGHIPGALNLPWSSVSDAQGFARPVSEQRARWADIDPDEETVVYCGSGVSACVNLLSLSLAGLPRARLYAGSWSDWCSYL
ncbi:MAG: sulfurtransferase [Pseudomonadota bacterium]